MAESLALLFIGTASAAFAAVALFALAATVDIVKGWFW